MTGKLSLLERMKAKSASAAPVVAAKPTGIAALKAQASAVLSGGSGGTSTGSTTVNATIEAAKGLLSTAEEQLQKDRASGLFDLKDVKGTEIPVDKFLENFQALRYAQLAKTPQLPQLQVATMNNLRQYEELAHILTDAQLAVIISGALEVANVKVATGKAKASSTEAVKAKAKTLSLTDF